MTIGIYRIYNKTSGKSYIGQSKNVERRINEHFYSLNRGVHPNHHLQSAFLLYGAENFGHQLIETCEEEALTQREEYWIDAAHHYAGVYNLTLIATPGCKGYKHTEESLRIMSEAQRGNTKTKGKTWKQSKVAIKTEETRRKISEKNKARSSTKVMTEKRKGRPPTEKEMAHILKLAEKRRALAVRNNVN